MTDRVRELRRRIAPQSCAAYWLEVVEVLVEDELDRHGVALELRRARVDRRRVRQQRLGAREVRTGERPVGAHPQQRRRVLAQHREEVGAPRGDLQRDAARAGAHRREHLGRPRRHAVPAGATAAGAAHPRLQPADLALGVVDGALQLGDPQPLGHLLHLLERALPPVQPRLERPPLSRRRVGASAQFRDAPPPRRRREAQPGGARPWARRRRRHPRERHGGGRREKTDGEEGRAHCLGLCAEDDSESSRP